MDPLPPVKYVCVRVIVVLHYYICFYFNIAFQFSLKIKVSFLFLYNLVNFSVVFIKFYLLYVFYPIQVRFCFSNSSLVELTEHFQSTDQRHFNLNLLTQTTSDTKLKHAD